MELASGLTLQLQNNKSFLAVIPIIVLAIIVLMDGALCVWSLGA